MFTEFKNQNNGNNKVVYNKKNETNLDNNDDELSAGNKFFGAVWKITLVIVVFAVSIVVMIHFNVISFASKILPDAIILNQNEVGIKKGKGYQLIATILPENSENKRLKYESSDSSVVYVNEVTGYVTALREGTATITAVTDNGVAASTTVSVGNKMVSLSSIILNSTNINLAAGSTYLLSYRVEPSNATELNMNFTSSDPTVATVDSNGRITGIKEGSAVITVSSNNNSIKAEANVSVYKKGEVTVVEGNSYTTTDYPSSVSTPKEKSLTLGATVLLEPTVSPSGAVDSIRWLSNNPKIATVDENGLVTAKGIGTTEIVASTVNNLTSVTRVTVGNFSVGLSKIYITTKYTYLVAGSPTKQLFVAYEPVNASNPSVQWTSANPEVVEIVNQSGVIKAKGSGSTTITAKTTDGKLSDTITVEVGGGVATVPVKSISVGAATRELFVGSTDTLSPIFNPSNATYKAVSYSSSDESIATVDLDTGKVIGLKEGTVTISVRTKRENISTSVTYTVKNNPAVSVELSETVANLAIGDSMTLSATVNPSNASNKTVTYSSSDPNVASVNQYGEITGVSAGTATITVTPNGGGSSSTCMITVY